MQHVGIESGVTISENRDGSQDGRFDGAAERAFRVAARRNRLLGIWAAQRLGLTEAEADSYARSLVQTDFEGAGDEGVIRKLIGDLLRAGVETRDIEVRAMLSKLTEEARLQIDQQTEKAG